MDLGKLKGLGDWPKMRREIEASVTTVLGKLPKLHMDPQVKTVEELEFPGYVRRRINYFVDEWDRVSAWYFVPDGKEEKPAILCCHQTSPQGKDETAGIEGDPMLAFARRYAERGYVTLAPDCMTAGERVSEGLKPFETELLYRDYPKLSAVGKMLADHMRCVDVLTDAREVDASRIGVVGHDLGGYNGLFLVAFDERVQVCVSSCGFTNFAEDEDPGRWARDSGLVLFPKLCEAAKKREFPFDWEHILALITPSPTLLITALNDEVLSNTKSCEKAANRARKVYKFLGADAALGVLTHKEGHRMTLETLDAADEWFERWL